MLNTETALFELCVGGRGVFSDDFRGEQLVVFRRRIVQHADVRGGMVVAHRPQLKVGSDSRVSAAAAPRCQYDPVCGGESRLLQRALPLPLQRRQSQEAEYHQEEAQHERGREVDDHCVHFGGDVCVSSVALGILSLRADSALSLIEISGYTRDQALEIQWKDWYMILNREKSKSILKCLNTKG